PPTSTQPRPSWRSKLAKLDDGGAWASGYLSMVHWLSVHLGLGRVSARELVRVGHALVELPRVAEAFASGSLSYDKVRFIWQVATPEDQEVWVELAQGISGGAGPGHLRQPADQDLPRLPAGQGGRLRGAGRGSAGPARALELQRRRRHGASYRTSAGRGRGGGDDRPRGGLPRAAPRGPQGHNAPSPPRPRPPGGSPRPPPP